jgi:parallel beta-helix repeat protein
MSNKSRLIGLGAALISLAAILFGWFSLNNGQIGLAQAGKPITVCASGCDFTKIQAAIDSAQNGSAIQVQTGSYKENLSIRNKDGLTLKGAGPDQVTLDGNGPQQQNITPGILILSSRNITVTGFKITNSRRGLEADDTTLLFIEANTFDKNLRSGLTLLRSQVEIKGNIIQGTQVDLDASNGVGISLEGSQGTLSDNTIIDNADCGVRAMLSGDQPSQASGSNNTIQHNKGGDLCGNAPTSLLAQPLPEGMLDPVTVPTDAATIQEAVNKAKAGGTITVVAGTYKEQIQIYKSVTIRGAGSDQTVVQAPSIEYVAINIATDQLQVTLEGLKVTGGRRGVNVATGPAGNVAQRDVKIEANGAGQTPTTSDAGLKSFEQTTVALDHVSIINNQEMGLQALGRTQVTIQNSTISDNVGWGIYVGDTAHAQITNNQINGSKPTGNPNFGWGYGISVYNTAQVTLQGNTISQNASYAIVLRYNSQATIQQNTISNNKSVGIELFEASNGTITKNTISDNEVAGIGLHQTSKGTITENTIARNREEGIWVGDSATAQITNNQITASKPTLGASSCCGFGINLRQNAQATIQGNTISQNVKHGILLQESSQATVRQNTITNNGSRGVELDSNSNATIDSNTITGNIGQGISLWDSAQAQITNNQITGNKPGDAGSGQGIGVYMASRPTITNNTIKSNAANGIVVGTSAIDNETAQAEISSNTIQNNSLYGVWADNDSGITITGQGNTISGNTSGQLGGTTSKFPTGFGGGK